MTKIDLVEQAEMLIAKVKHYLITTMGRVSSEADPDEFYRALSYALREEIMINWLASTRTQTQHDVKQLYYLSMEYLPGRIFSNNINNIHANEIVRIVLQKMDRNYVDIINREPDPGLGNGGLGRLASCFLDSLATQNLPSKAYGLRYQYGIFEQQIWDGLQIEAPDCWLINENPWEFRRDLRKFVVKYCGHTINSKNIHGDEIQTLEAPEEVWALPYDIPIVGYRKDEKFSVMTLRLWSTKESPHNFQLQRYNAGRLDQAAENTALTDVLYPNDHHETGKRVRLKQEFLLVSASLQDIFRHYLLNHTNLRSFADKVCIQINDTHPSMVVAELIRILTKDYDIPWQMAVDITMQCTGFTNHTVLSEALEQWDQGLFNYLLPRQYKIIERLNQEFCNSIRTRYPNDEEKIRRMSILENGKVRMANLAVIGSHSINGVAALHTDILKNVVFKDYYELFPERFVNITNGVTQRRWLLHCNPKLSTFITERIGDGWITDFPQIKNLAQFANDPQSQNELMNIKRKNKSELVEFLKQNNKLRNAKGNPTIEPPILDVSSLFDIQVKRIHEYKRQLLNILHVIMLYQEISSTPEHQRIKRTVIFAGKAAAGYETAKDIIRFIYCVARKINKDPRVNNTLKIVYIENYNVSRAEIIIPAGDLSEQISTAGTEASGTGNMKLAINGALTIGTDDGANIEMKEQISEQWWPFRFGCSANEIAAMASNGTYHPREIYESNPLIKKAVETLQDGTFANNDAENRIFNGLYNKLLEYQNGEAPDRYFILKDLESYYHTQKKVEKLYTDPNKWAEYVMHNIAGMGNFSTDVSIKNYCEKIWGLQECPTDEDTLKRIRHEYDLIDKCRIY